MSYNPYQSPQANVPKYQQPIDPNRMPGVWPCFLAYCIFMALVYLGFAVLCGFIAVMAAADMDRDPDAAVALVMMIGVAVLCVAMMFVYIVGPLLPRKKVAWVVGIVLIALGLTTCYTLPFAIPLLIFWIRPETKAYYGMLDPLVAQPAYRP